MPKHAMNIFLQSHLAFLGQGQKPQTTPALVRPTDLPKGREPQAVPRQGEFHPQNIPLPDGAVGFQESPPQADILHQALEEVLAELLER